MSKPKSTTLTGVFLSVSGCSACPAMYASPTVSTLYTPCLSVKASNLPNRFSMKETTSRGVLELANFVKPQRSDCAMQAALYLCEGGGALASRGEARSSARRSGGISLFSIVSIRPCVSSTAHRDLNRARLLASMSYASNAETHDPPTKRNLPICEMYKFVNSSRIATATAKPMNVRDGMKDMGQSPVYTVKKSTKMRENCWL
mmetsp:Transcript_38908/g.103385  ORF Transcript_38908/g.103385 Transcript_38908/m.103385 type:complete len:203 (+) Transcript_38908:546-1154(+)